MTVKELRAAMVAVSLTSAFFFLAGGVMQMLAPEESAAVLTGLLYVMFATSILIGFVFRLTRPEMKEESNDSRNPQSRD